MKWSPWGGAETSWLHTRTAEQTNGVQAAANGSLLSGQGTERMIPDTFSSSFLLALGTANQVLIPQPLEPLSHPTGETATSAGGACSFKGKYCCKPFRTSQGARNLCQSLRMHSKHLHPAARIAFFTLKSLRHLESVRLFCHCLSNSGIKNYVFGSTASLCRCEMIFIYSF